MRSSMYPHGIAIMSGSVPHLKKSNRIASIIDNGVGSYQVVFAHPVEEDYTLMITPKETRDEGPVIACERNFFERSELDFLIELKDHENNSVDADFNFMVMGKPYG